ncbi:hypothetical protein LDENG_00190320 [Lucifuga dentata]|nr:hypothetical protein LDENG_00190320 [Lucifuga dentata]
MWIASIPKGVEIAHKNYGADAQHPGRADAALPTAKQLADPRATSQKSPLYTNGQWREGSEQLLTAERREPRGAGLLEYRRRRQAATENTKLKTGRERDVHTATDSHPH